MKKILFGINRLSVGGAERLVLLQLAHLDPSKYEGHLVTLFPTSGPTLESQAAFLGARWKKLHFSGIGDLKSWWALYQYLRHEEFDAVVANLFFTSFVVRIAAILAGVPIIISAELNINAQRSLFERSIERILARFTARYTAVSSDVLAFSARQLQLPREQFALVYSAVDSTPLLHAVRAVDREQVRKRLGIPSNVCVFVTGGRLVEQKGHSYLIDAVASIKQRTPELKMHVVIGGEGPLRNELEERAREHGVDTFITMPGVLPVEELLAIGDVFVFPSLWEGLSLMLLEAMTVGLPVLATRVSGSSEVIVDGENGYLVPAGDVESLAQRMEDLVANEGLRSRFSAQVSQDAKRYSIENSIQSLVSVIEEESAKRAHVA